ncbi:MAG: DNA polymerase III subunit gamma/tau, partial [Collinsella sp.]|nr:DNA polymerase III subunit gamma/tau [Collinsella sp.]
RAEGASGCMPDGTCEECELIAEGNHPDVYELDAASRTGVDNVREEIINSVNFAPVRGKYKIYIIDEVHMLTTAAFNALLKTLEEPPAHVIFVLCTTDPQKILETILSRCQRFDFHRIGNEDIERRLAYVCEQEGFDYDDEALAIVARHAKGGMRDALSTLEQLSVFGNGAVHADDARSLLGEVSDQILGEFARAIADRDVAELYGLIRAQVEEGNDLLELTRDLVAHVRDVYVACVAGARAELFEGGSEQAEALAAEAAAFGEHPADRLARVLTVLDDAALEMRGASDVRLVLEIACTRLARPEADLTIEALAERVARLEAMVANGAVPASVAAAQASAPAASAPAVQQPTLISGARAAAPVASAAPAATSAHQGGMPWDRGAAVPAAQPAPKSAAPAPAPKPAAAPAPKSSDLAKAPWLRSDNPAGAPATGKLPTEPAPRAPERSAAPKSQPAASSALWESEQVPYDDAMVGGFAADAGGDDLPPFDVPGAASAPKP